MSIWVKTNVPLRIHEMLKDDTQVEQYYKTAYDLIQNKNRKITLKKEIIEVVVEKNDLEYRTPYSVTD